MSYRRQWADFKNSPQFFSASGYYILDASSNLAGSIYSLSQGGAFSQTVGQLNYSHDFHFSQWAHKVNSASANLQSVKLKPKQKKSIQISSLKELDEQMASNPKLAALPSNPKKLSRALRKMPTGIEIKEGEVLALVDTGSNIHAADVDLHFNSSTWIESAYA